MSNDDAIVGIGLSLIGIALIIYGVIIFVIVWAIISAIIGYLQYKKYLKEAEEEFDEIAQEIGIDLPIDEILETVMGVEVPDAPGFETVADWMAGTPLGVTEEWES